MTADSMNAALIARAQKIRQVVEVEMLDRTRGSIKSQKPRSIARLDRGLGNQLRRQIVIEFAGLHLFTIRIMMFNTIVARMLMMIILARGKKHVKFWV